MINSRASVQEAQSALMFPYAAIGAGYSSTLTVANVGQAPQTLTVTFGTASASVQLGANSATRLSIADLLHLPVDSFRAGAVRVFPASGSGGASLVGVLDVENTVEGATIDARPAGTDFTFPNVANGNGYFTGLAFATGNAPAKITIDVYPQSGGTPLSMPFSLDANQEVARLLSEFVPASVNQQGGYIRIHSDQPISTWEIYGTPSGMASGPPL
jgi:hypothetical protein